MSIKRFVFDVSTYTYTLLVAAYCVSPINEETFLTHFGPLLGAGAAAVAVSALLAALLPGPSLGDLLFGRTQRKTWHSIYILILFILTLWISLEATEASFSELFDRQGLSGAARLWLGLSHPNFALIPKALAQAVSTVLIAFLGTVIAIPVAFVLAFFAAKNIMTSKAGLAIYALLRLGLNVTRSVEPLIWALIFTVWVGVGPFAGMLALLVHSVASLTKYYSEIIEDVAEGPIDGVRSTGANNIQVVWYAIVPQVMLPFIAMTVYRWDTNVRMATVIGLVGGGGIGTLLVQYQGQAMWPEVGAIILVIAVIVWLLDTASAYIREALR